MRDTFIEHTAREVEFREIVPASILKGSIFRQYEEPSELCDGGDYIKEVQIRIDDDKGKVYISVSPMERSEWWSGEMTWNEFFIMMLKAVKTNKKIKYHRR